MGVWWLIFSYFLIKENGGVDDGLT